MAGLAEYIAGLSGNYAKLNPYSTIGSGISSVNLPTEGNSLNQNIAASIIKGLLSGGLQAYGNYENKQYEKGLREAILTGSTNADLSDSELEDIKGQASVFSLGKKQEREELMDQLGLKAKFAGIEEKEKKKGELDAYESDLADGSPSVLNPINKENREIAEKQASDILNSSKFIEGSEIGRQYAQVNPTLTQALSTIDKPDKVSDLQLFVALAKANDPVGAISDRSIQSVQDAVPYLQKAFGSIEGFFSQEGILKPEAKLKILNAIVDKNNALATQYDSLIKSEKERLKILGIADPKLSTLPSTPFDFNNYLAKRNGGIKLNNSIENKIPPGMKLERSRLTGQTRLVPQ